MDPGRFSAQSTKLCEQWKQRIPFLWGAELRLAEVARADVQTHEGRVYGALALIAEAGEQLSNSCLRTVTDTACQLLAYVCSVLAPVAMQPETWSASTVALRHDAWSLSAADVTLILERLLPGLAQLYSSLDKAVKTLSYAKASNHKYIIRFSTPFYSDKVLFAFTSLLRVSEATGELTVARRWAFAAAVVDAASAAIKQIVDDVWESNGCGQVDV
ncbi:hypothetical protein WJX81_002143 [Elliptochloris bilobata]|uniref:Uncharacterized protein n=1 Tax=Elliptochloris bilobata TaxID=381761 RepID=A0AAW1RIE9_9CHLO